MPPLSSCSRKHDRGGERTSHVGVKDFDVFFFLFSMLSSMMFTSLRVHLCMVQSADESPRGGPHLGDSIHRVMGLDSLESLPRHAVMILLGPGRKEQTELERCRIGAVEYLRKPILTLHTIAFVVLSQLALSYSAFGPQLSFLPLILLRHSQTRPNPGWQPCHLYSHLELPASLLLM